MSESYRQLSTILAALRLFQAAQNVPPDIAELADSGGEIEPLTADEIGDLCEALNCGGYISPDATPSERMAHAIACGVTFAEGLSAFAADQAAKEPELAAYSQNASGMRYVRDGEVEVDTSGPGGSTIVSKGADAGAYTLGWIWVDDETAGIETADDADADSKPPGSTGALDVI